MDPELLIILFLILAPLLERLLKVGQKKKPPAPRREIPRREPPRRMPAPSTRTADDEPSMEQPAARREDETAATILPEDLWEILTGERQFPQPVPAPQPVPEPYEESYDEIEPVHEWEQEESVVVPEPVPRPREGLYASRDRTEPQVVSLEPLELDDEERHRRFHERVSVVTTAATEPTGPAVFRFRSGEDLRRAMIVTEVLGPPKGLQ